MASIAFAALTSENNNQPLAMSSRGVEDSVEWAPVKLVCINVCCNGRLQCPEANKGIWWKGCGAID